MKPGRLARPAIVVAISLWTACIQLNSPAEPPRPAGVANLDEAGWERLRREYRGRILLVNFWATWCDPCREEFPALVKLERAYRARGLSVVCISMDEPESVPDIEKFLKSQGAEFGSYRHNFRDFAALVDSINSKWAGAIPANFLYDRQGGLAQSWVGATSFDELDRSVRKLLP